MRRPLHQREVWWVVEDIAKYLRVSKMTVYRRIHAGELPAVRIGRSFRVSDTDLNEYLETMRESNE
jgi:excisionase family DNA binding protein